MSRSVQSVLSSLQDAAAIAPTIQRPNLIDELRQRTNNAPQRNAGPGIRSTVKQPTYQEPEAALPVTAEGSDSRIVLRDINTGEFAPAEDAGKKNVTTDFVDLPKLSAPSLKAEKAKKATAKKTATKKLASPKVGSKIAAQKKPVKKLASNKQGSKIGNAKKKTK